MRRISSILTILIIVLVSVGFLRGWLSLTGGKEAVTHKIGVNLTVDPDKVEADVTAVEDKAAELTGRAKANVKEVIHPTADQVPPKGE